MSLIIEGRLYDGKDSSAPTVQLFISQQGDVSIDTQNPPIGQATQVVVSPRVSNTARHLSLPDGRQFETRDNDAVDELCLRWQPTQQTLPHRLESNLKWVGASLIGLIVIGYVAVVFGLPLMSKQITALLPTSLDNQLAEHALPQLDKTVFKASTLSDDRKQTLSERFHQLLPDSDRTYRLYFRDGGPLGANAFALPNGTIILTDQLIALADNEHMITSVLLHEIGHIEHRHSMQNIVRQAGLSTLIAAMTGDVGMASSLVLLLPTLLVQADYSREFEWEADTYALQAMINHQIAPTHFANMMEKLSDQASHTKEDAEATHWLDYFASHPASQKRSERFRKAAAGNQPQKTIH